MKNKSVPIIVALFFITLPAFAQAALEVVFEETPLFLNAKVLPGDAVTRTVQVSNTGTEAEEIIFSLDNTYSDGLADVMEVAVTSGADVYLDTTFISLFNLDEISLGNLPAGSSKIYEFTSFLSPAVGNEYQFSNLGFDLLIGFLSGEAVTDNPPSSSSGGGGGGSVFSLFNEDVVVENNTSAQLTWNTNRPATSFIVCGNDVEGPFVLDPDEIFFGYVFASTEDVAKTLTHEVDTTDLSVGTYSCRVASREKTTDDFTVSGELHFEIVPGGQVAGITSSQPVTQGNYFQPTPSVAGAYSGGKGSLLTYDEYRAELDEANAARELIDSKTATVTKNKIQYNSKSSLQAESKSQEKISTKLISLAVLVILIVIIGFIFYRQRR